MCELSYSEWSVISDIEPLVLIVLGTSSRPLHSTVEFTAGGRKIYNLFCLSNLKPKKKKSCIENEVWELHLKGLHSSSFWPRASGVLLWKLLIWIAYSWDGAFSNCTDYTPACNFNKPASPCLLNPSCNLWFGEVMKVQESISIVGVGFCLM